MKAVILAAGMATRLRPLTLDTPKCLLKVRGEELLRRSMNALIASGVKDFIIVTGYLAPKIVSFVNAAYSSKINVKFVHNELYASTNNIYSLHLACEDLEAEPIVLLDSDLYYDAGLLAKLFENPSDNVLSLVRHELGEEEMKVLLDEEGRIEEISKTCDPKSAAGESLGIEKMGSAYVSALKAELEVMMREGDNRNLFYEKAFERLIAKGHSYHVEDVTEFSAMELDTVEDFLAANKEG